MANTASPSQIGGTASKRGRMLLIGGSVLVLALGAGGFVLGSILGNRQPAAAAVPAAPVIPPPIFVPLDAFTVNLKSEDGDRFLHTGLSLKVADADTQARWWMRVKDEWEAAARDQRPFVNPLKPMTLRWMS